MSDFILDVDQQQQVTTSEHDSWISGLSAIWSVLLSELNAYNNASPVVVPYHTTVPV